MRRIIITKNLSLKSTIKTFEKKNKEEKISLYLISTKDFY